MIEVLKQALEALETLVPAKGGDRYSQAATALRTAIEQAEKQGPEPIDHLLAENARLWGLIYDLHKKIAPDTTQAGDGDCTDGERLCAELKAKEQKEPVAWMSKEDYEDFLDETKITSAIVYNYEIDIPLYTTPQPQEFVCSTGLCHYKPQREWVGLTDEDKQIAFDDTQEASGGFWEFADAIEAKLKEKNT